MMDASGPLSSSSPSSSSPVSSSVSKMSISFWLAFGFCFYVSTRSVGGDGFVVETSRRLSLLLDFDDFDFFFPLDFFFPPPVVARALVLRAFLPNVFQERRRFPRLRRRRRFHPGRRRHRKSSPSSRSRSSAFTNDTYSSSSSIVPALSGVPNVPNTAPYVSRRPLARRAFGLRRRRLIRRLLILPDRVSIFVPRPDAKRRPVIRINHSLNRPSVSHDGVKSRRDVNAPPSTRRLPPLASRRNPSIRTPRSREIHPLERLHERFARERLPGNPRTTIFRARRRDVDRLGARR